ncbi:MAG: DUF805 domain-containing protein [Hyphomicrobiaceae bacterium]|nr:DUF805 domain-containing protein [Hyphomicrobiaceae bacterium]
MTFTDAVRTCFSKYATFSGRAARPEYWWWVLFSVLVNIASNIVDAYLIAPALGLPPFGENSAQPLSIIVGLALLLPGLAVAVRRLHDIDRSGWWMLIALIPIIGLIVLIYWAVQPGTESDNQYGPGRARDAAY